MVLSNGSLNTDFQGLQQARLANNPYKTDYTEEDFGGKGVVGSSALNGVSTGMSLGSVFGPLGTIVGAAAGGALGLLSGNVKKAAAVSRAYSANMQNDYMNQQTDNEINNTSNNIATNEWLDTMKQNNITAFGGYIPTMYNPLALGGLNQASSPYTEYNAGGTHESNPLGGIMVGMGANGLPNKVEEGEVKYGDYVFSNRLKPSKEFREKYKTGDKTFAELFKKYMKDNKETEDDPITKKGIQQYASILAQEQEAIKQAEAQEQQQLMQIAQQEAAQQAAMQDAQAAQAAQMSPEDQQAIQEYLDAGYSMEDLADMGSMEYGKGGKLCRYNNFAEGGYLTDNLYLTGGELEGEGNGLETEIQNSDNGLLNALKGIGSNDNDFEPFNDGSLISAATLIPQAISTIGALIKKPDYSTADTIADARKNLTYVTPHINSSRMEYNPVDSNRYLSALRNNQGTLNNQIREIAGANRLAAMAALQGGNRDYTSSLGQLMPQIEQLNETRRNQALQFNSSIEAQNNAARAQADSINQQVNSNRYNSIIQEQQAREAVDSMLAQQRNTAVNSFLTNINNLGQEISNAERLNWLRKNTDMFGVQNKNKGTTESTNTPLSQRTTPLSAEDAKTYFNNRILEDSSNNPNIRLPNFKLSNTDLTAWNGVINTEKEEPSIFMPPQLKFSLLTSSNEGGGNRSLNTTETPVTINQPDSQLTAPLSDNSVVTDNQTNTNTSSKDSGNDWKNVKYKNSLDQSILSNATDGAYVAKNLDYSDNPNNPYYMSNTFGSSQISPANSALIPKNDRSVFYTPSRDYPLFYKDSNPYNFQDNYSYKKNIDSSDTLSTFPNIPRPNNPQLTVPLPHKDFTQQPQNPYPGDLLPILPIIERLERLENGNLIPDYKIPGYDNMPVSVNPYVDPMQYARDIEKELNMTPQSKEELESILGDINNAGLSKKTVDKLKQYYKIKFGRPYSGTPTYMLDGISVIAPKKK